MMGISEVGPTPRRPSSSSTAAVADVVPQNGLPLVAGWLKAQGGSLDSLDSSRWTVQTDPAQFFMLGAVRGLA